MPTHPLARLEVSTRVLKRAQYEAFEFEFYEGACKHRVAVAIRPPVLEVATRTQLATDGSGTSHQPLTEAEDLTEKDTIPSSGASSDLEDDDDPSDNDTDEEEAYPCECDDLTDEFPCWNCVLAGRRSLPDS